MTLDSVAGDVHLKEVSGYIIVTTNRWFTGVHAVRREIGIQLPSAQRSSFATHLE